MWLLHTRLHPFDRDIPGVTRQKRHNGKRIKIIYCLSFPYYDFTSGYTGLIHQIVIGCCRKKIILGRSNTNKSESHLMSATHDISPFDVNENQVKIVSYLN